MNASETGVLKSLLSEILAMMNLTLPKPRPVSTPDMLVYRLIAGFLSLPYTMEEDWECRNGFNDSSGYDGCYTKDYFDGFPAAKKRLEVKSANDLNRQSAYRFWFLLKNQKPCFCLETTGTVWREDGSEFQIDKMYQKDRRIWPLLNSIMGDIL